MLPALVFGTIAYLMTGLRRDATTFLLFEVTVALVALNAGLLCSAIGLAFHRTQAAATLLAAMLVLEHCVWGGLLANVDCMTQIVSWMRYTSWAYYAYDLMLTEELRGELVKVTVPGGPSVWLQAETLLELLGLGKPAASVEPCPPHPK